MADPELMLAIIRQECETRVMCSGCFLKCDEKAVTFHDAMARLPCKPELIEYSIDTKEDLDG
jgi:hypothetical protein